MGNEEKLLIARTNDMLRQCKRRQEPVFSSFLDAKSQLIIKNEGISDFGFSTEFFGGYEMAERKMLGIFPDWTDSVEFPIKVLEIKSGAFKTLTHRDYLGTLMAQGIDRSKTGDIIVCEDKTYVFVCEDISCYLADNIKKIGNSGVKIKVIDIFDMEIPEPKTEEIRVVCASLRLDAVVGALINVSRNTSAQLIRSGLVKLNHIECMDVSKTIKENDLLSIRGYGRFLYSSCDGETRKGRIHITAKKYI